MPAVRRIHSRHNQRFKMWQRYVAYPERDDCPWVAVEGWKQVRQLATARALELLLFSDPEDKRLQELPRRSRESVCVPQPLLQRLSSVQSPQGMMAFFRKPAWTLEDLTTSVLYLYGLQDPGNLGTLFRTSQATGIFSVVTSSHTVSCFNSKAVRASAGSLFTVPFRENVEAETLQRRGYQLWAATPEKGQSMFEVRLRSPLAVVIGNEGSGLEEQLKVRTSGRVQIPMHSQSESLNAAVAGSLIAYEVLRQREANG